MASPEITVKRLPSSRRSTGIQTPPPRCEASPPRAGANAFAACSFMGTSCSIHRARLGPVGCVDKAEIDAHLEGFPSQAAVHHLQLTRPISLHEHRSGSHLNRHQVVFGHVPAIEQHGKNQALATEQPSCGLYIWVPHRSEDRDHASMLREFLPLLPHPPSSMRTMRLGSCPHALHHAMNSMGSIRRSPISERWTIVL